MSWENIDQVKWLSDTRDVNTLLKEGWIVLDARVIQLSPESLEKAKPYYILGKQEERVA